MRMDAIGVRSSCDTAATKVVTITGAGRFFCAGGDLKAIAAAPDPGTYVKGIADDLHRALSTFARMDAVVLTVVNGTAAGAGFSVAVTGDLVLAAESAKFTMAYTKAGLSPDGGASYYLPRLIGLRRTQQLMLTNRTLSATEALEWGLLTDVVPDAELSARADALAQELANTSRTSNATVKRLLLGSSRSGLEEQLEAEARAIAESVRSADGQEGVAAFLEKRAPQFG